MSTGIEWTDETWNPTTGCTKVSPGCDHCYAEVMYERFNGKGSFATVKMHSSRLAIPFHWRKPRKVFVNSMSDLFHQDVTDFFIAEVYAVMATTRRHTYQILTKRHARMRSLLSSDSFRDLVNAALKARGQSALDGSGPVVLPNVWLGVSVENQQWADIRWPALRDTPAAVRFLSMEPLLGPVELDENWLHGDPECQCDDPAGCHTIDWVIVGGESGHGARPMHPDWARSLRDQCEQADIPFLFKQRGEWTWNEGGNFRMPGKPLTDRVAVIHPAGMTALTKRNPFDPFAVGHPHWGTRIERVGKHAAGRELDGRTHDAYPVPATA